MANDKRFITKNGFTSLGNSSIGSTNFTPQANLHIQDEPVNAGSTTLKIGSDGSFGNHVSRLELAEQSSAGSMTYGFSLTGDGNNTNNLLLRSHDNSNTGTVALSVVRSSGFVGIGTTSAGTLFDVNGNARVRGDGSTMAGVNVGNASLLVGSSAVGIGIDDNEIVSSGTDLYLGAVSGYGTVFRVGASEHMRVHTNGNVGIGTNNPYNKLHVNGNGRINNLIVGNSNIINTPTTTAGIHIKSSGTDTVFRMEDSDGSNSVWDFLVNASSGLSFQYRGTSASNAASTYMFVSENGTLSVGSTFNPGAALTVDGTGGQDTSSSTLVLYDNRPTAADVGGSINFSFDWNGTDGHLGSSPFIKGYKVNASTSDYSSGLKFGTRKNGQGTNAVAMTIDEDQNVGIGTTSPDTNLHVFKASAGTITNYADNALVVENSTDVGISLLTPNASAGHLMFGSPGNQYHSYIRGGYGASTTSTLKFYTDGINTMTHKAGNVGIGTDNPQEHLHVWASTSGTPHWDNSAHIKVEGLDARLQIMAGDDGSNGASLLLSNEDQHWIHHAHATTGSSTYSLGYYNSPSSGFDGANSSSEILNITTGGSIGINITNPSATLHVQQNVLSNKAISSNASMVVEATEAQLQILGENSGDWASNITLTNVPTSGTNKHWTIHHAPTTEGDYPDSLYFRRQETNTAAQIGGDGAGVDALVLEPDGDIRTFHNHFKVNNTTDHSDSSWYSVDNTHNIVQIKDSWDSEVYIKKEAAGAGYSYFTLYPEEVGKNFDVSFRLEGTGTGTYRHLAIAMGSDGTNTVNNFDYIVFRQNFSNSSLNQIRLDSAGSTVSSLVGVSVPNFFDGTIRNIMIKVRNGYYQIWVDDVLEHSFTQSRTNLRGRIGFAIYEAASSLTYVKIKNFQITQHAGNEDSAYLSGSNELLVPNSGVIRLNGTNPAIHFNGSIDGSISDADMAIIATPEGLDFIEPEDTGGSQSLGGRLQFRIIDDTGVDSYFGYRVAGTELVTSGRAIINSTSVGVNTNAVVGTDAHIYGDNNRFAFGAITSNLAAQHRIEFWETAVTSTGSSANFAIEYDGSATYGGDGAFLFRGQGASANQVFAGVSRTGTTFLGMNGASPTVGIGTTNPTNKLDVRGNVTQIDGSPEYHFATASATHYNWRIATQEVVDAGFEIASGQQTAGTSANSDTYTNRLVIKADTGRVGIGTDAPAATLHVYGTATFQSNDGVKILSATNNPTNGAIIYFSDNIPAQSQNGFIKYKHSDSSVVAGSNEQMVFGGDQPISDFLFEGDVHSSGDVVAYFSDPRLKDFHGNITGALDKVNSLGGYYFTENELAKEIGYRNDRMQVGVNADEVAAVLPEVVTTALVNENIPQDEVRDYKTVKYEKMVPLLIEAIKELTEQNMEMKQRLDRLEGEA